MLVRLKESGSIDALEKKEGDSENMIERRAMLVYAGTFQSMDGEVVVSKSHIKNLVKNHNSFLGKFKRLASGLAAMKNYPPIQLDHSTSARDTIGRLVGDLEVEDYEDEDGKKMPAVFGNVRILGRENVERVNDGRWTHLSIGADFDKGSVSELTVTPFPAAKNASMLKAGTSKQGFKRLKIVSQATYKDVSITIETDPNSPGFFWVIADKTGSYFNGCDHGSPSSAMAEAKKFADTGNYRKMDRLSSAAEKQVRLAALKKQVRLSALRASVLKAK